MASMRKLRRRLARWDRYAARYGYSHPAAMTLDWDPPLRGHWDAYWTAWGERERRRVRTVYWPTTTGDI